MACSTIALLTARSLHPRSGSSGCSGGGSSSSHAAEVPDVRGKRHRLEEERPAARETRRRYERHEGDIDMDEEAEQRRLEWR